MSLVIIIVTADHYFLKMELIITTCLTSESKYVLKPSVFPFDCVSNKKKERDTIELNTIFLP